MIKDLKGYEDFYTISTNGEIFELLKKRKNINK